MAASHTNTERTSWPKRAVVTAGMPYGNKALHFGHIAGVFVPADAFARFLRDRIGAANVRFISGTDCFGSPINEGYRKLVEAGEFDGTIAEYVERNHEAQKNTLDAYGISLSIYEGSGMGHSGDVHQLITEKFIEKLHENGWLHLQSTLQFYDAQAQTFLNGRQVVGRCPVQGCKSEHAYADECDLGHSYAPEDLIAPKSTACSSCWLTAQKDNRTIGRRCTSATRTPRWRLPTVPISCWPPAPSASGDSWASPSTACGPPRSPWQPRVKARAHSITSPCALPSATLRPARTIWVTGAVRSTSDGREPLPLRTASLSGMRKGASWAS